MFTVPSSFEPGLQTQAGCPDAEAVQPADPAAGSGHEWSLQRHVW